MHEQWRYVAFDLVNQGGQWVNLRLKIMEGKIWNVDEKHLQHGESSYLQVLSKHFLIVKLYRIGSFFAMLSIQKAKYSPTWKHLTVKFFAKYTTVTL